MWQHRGSYSVNEHILLAYKLDSDGGGEAISGNTISDQIKDSAITRIHLDANSNNTRVWLENEASHLDPFVIEALLAEETRPRMVEINNGVLLILRGVNLNDNCEPEDMISIRLWVEADRIISLRKRRLKAITDIETKIKQGLGPKDTGEFVCMLITRLFERMEPVLSDLDDLTDDIESRILERSDKTLRESIINVRKEAILIRRYMAPQRDAISQLHMANIKWLKETHRHHLLEAYNHVTRYVEDLDAIRERAQIIKDELANIISDKLNRNMYVLSVIAAIFLPLGFLTGLLGINVGGIPGADNVNAFYIFCFILSAIVLIQVVIFKLFKWF